MQSIPLGTTGSFSLVVMPDHLATWFTYSDENPNRPRLGGLD